MGTSTSITFKLNSTANDNGLIITPITSDIIPDITSTGSVVNIKVKGTGTISANAGEGETRNIKFGVFNRNNYASNDSWDDNKFEKSTGTYQIGRFMSDIGTDSTKTIEYFNRETFRLKSGSTSTNAVDIESLTVSEASFETLLTSNFKSTESIENTKELQQIIGGKLIYPVQLNTAVTYEPNLVDYNTANFETYATTPANVRWYYRAFQFEEFKESNLSNFANTDFSSTNPNSQTKFKIRITYDGIASSEVLEQFSLTDHASNDLLGDILLEGGRKVNKMQIALRLPGPVSAGSSQQSQQPGTKWGIVNNSNVGPTAPPNSDVFSMLDGSEDIEVNTSAKTVTIPVLFRSGWRLKPTKGVILMRIVINKDWGKSTSDFTSPGWTNVSNGSPGVIKKIELLPN